MNTTLYIIIGMLILSMLAPFVALYAATLIRKKEYKAHIRIQKWLFWICILGVVILELQIRLSGGSGSLVATGTYVNAPFFKPILAAHVIGAILTYTIWALQFYLGSRQRKRAGGFSGGFSGRFVGLHKSLGYVTTIGLFYTGITALAVCMLAFFL